MRKFKKLAISIMSCVFAMSVGLLAWMGFDASKIKNAGASISVEYKDVYTAGETVVIQPAEFDYQGKKYGANAVVRFPNGNTYIFDQLVLTELGDYTIEYSAVADDNTLLRETRSFTVLANTYSFDGEGSYEYGTNRYLGENVQGLNVKLGRNSTFTVNTPINVSNLTKDDSIFKFYATPDMQGTAEVGWMYVRLTDAHNPENWVEWIYQPVGTFQYVYGNASGQQTIGLRQTSTPSVDAIEYDGYYYLLYQNNTSKKGHVTRASLTGTIDNNNKTNLVSKYYPNNAVYTDEELFFYNALEVRMDYAQKRMYAQPDGVYSITRAIVADLDDERTLGDKAPWQGFTTGEAILSVYAKDYTAANFNFFITDIYGQDLNKTTTKNEIPPRLEVDTQGYAADNLPNAIVGKQYPLFNATATDDVDGNLSVSVKVYNSIGATFSVVDGGFVPTRSGVYTVEYSAVDSFGNRTVKTFKVDAVDRAALQYELSEAGTTFLTGQEVAVAALTLQNPANLYDLKIYARLNGGDVEVEIDEETLTFVPLYAGKYAITYVYSDYCTEEVISYEITVNQSDLVVFDEDLTLPKYIIKGLEYPVARLYGYTFTNGTQRQQAALSIQEGNGAARSITGETYSVQGDVDTMQFVYELGGVQKVYERPVVDAVSKASGKYKIDLAKYFYSTVGNFTSDSERKKIKFTADETENGVARMEVINPAKIINDFEIIFEMETGKTNFTGVNVVFTSAYDANKTIVFQFEREVGVAAKVRVSANDYVAESSISSKFKTPSIEADKFNITYDVFTDSFMVGGFSVDAGKLLEGFADQFYISFELYGVEGDAGINISKVVNHAISSSTSDGVVPTMAYGSFKTYYVVGDEVVVNAVSLYDFVDPNPTCTLTLKKGGVCLISVDGVKLDGVENAVNRAYSVVVATAEDMEFDIRAKDFAGSKVADEHRLLKVKDVVAPIIELQIKTNVYSVGDTVTLADCVAIDDSTAQDLLEITYYVIYTDGSIKYLSSPSFTAEQAGTYTVYYIVRDEAGNNGYAHYTILVE